MSKMTPKEQAQLENLLLELQLQHRDLDQVIEHLLKSPSGDDLLLRRLKKRKLQLKDQIEQLCRVLIPDIPA